MTRLVWSLKSPTSRKGREKWGTRLSPELLLAAPWQKLTGGSLVWFGVVPLTSTRFRLLLFFPCRDTPDLADDAWWDYLGPSTLLAARLGRLARTLPFFRGLFPRECRGRWMWHRARWSAAGAFRRRRISGCGSRRRQVCNRLRRERG